MLNRDQNTKLVNENSFTIKNESNIAIVQFTPGHRHNPFSGQRMDALKNIIVELGNDKHVNSAILYGGEGNSFSVGGDFNEVSEFKGGKEVTKWIGSVHDLYKSVLEFPKPIIAAVGGYAIGFGLQLALTCDYRIGSNKSEFKMPEFAMGIACNFGGYILEKFVSRYVMQQMVFGCESVKAEEAKKLGIIHQVVEENILLSHAISQAENFALYPKVPVYETKKNLNKELIEGLSEICKQAKISHSKSFAYGAAQPKMKNIIKHQ